MYGSDGNNDGREWNNQTSRWVENNRNGSTIDYQGAIGCATNHTTGIQGNKSNVDDIRYNTNVCKNESSYYGDSVLISTSIGNGRMMESGSMVMDQNRHASSHYQIRNPNESIYSNHQSQMDGNLRRMMTQNISMHGSYDGSHGGYQMGDMNSRQDKGNNYEANRNMGWYQTPGQISSHTSTGQQNLTHVPNNSRQSQNDVIQNMYVNMDLARKRNRITNDPVGQEMPNYNQRVSNVPTIQRSNGNQTRTTAPVLQGSINTLNLSVKNLLQQYNPAQGDKYPQVQGNLHSSSAINDTSLPKQQGNLTRLITSSPNESAIYSQDFQRQKTIAADRTVVPGESHNKDIFENTLQEVRNVHDAVNDIHQIQASNHSDYEQRKAPLESSNLIQTNPKSIDLQKSLDKKIKKLLHILTKESIPIPDHIWKYFFQKSGCETADNTTGRLATLIALANFEKIILHASTIESVDNEANPITHNEGSPVQVPSRFSLLRAMNNRLGKFLVIPNDYYLSPEL